MKVHGCDCSIVIKTFACEINVPYSEETIREAVSLLQEEASIEGDGVSRAMRKSNGVTGCVVTPLTIGTAPSLLYLAMGSAGLPVYVSETRNLYQYRLNLLPLEDTNCFDLIQDRASNNEQGTGNKEQRAGNKERRLFEGCRVKGFELRFMREETLKLKLEICGERAPSVYLYTDTFTRESEERFSGENVTYQINGKEYSNIYGLTLVTKKEGGTKTKIWIKRALERGFELPHIIDDLVITAKLQKDSYEQRHFGLFRIFIKRLVLTSDETNVNSADTVIGPLRYYVAGVVKTEVFSNSDFHVGV